MIEILCFIAGAAVALYSYSWGRNNAAPVPSFSIPFLRAKADNGEAAAKPPVHSRGM